MILGERLWCTAELQVSSAKNGACDCKKTLIGMDKSAKITKRQRNLLLAPYS
jgi:hypothetical protein